MTLSEGLLWLELRKRPGGFKFRRQHPFGPFILDFYCSAARLAIEVDGTGHNMGDQPDKDIRREGWLRKHGVDVVRFAASDVMREIDSVVGEICRAVTARLPLHHAPHGSPPHDFVAGRN